MFSLLKGIIVASIDFIVAREILDSRGNPPSRSRSPSKTSAPAARSVPSGASTGQFEAVELRDGDKLIYGGRVGP